jgi:hypothetical protein
VLALSIAFINIIAAFRGYEIRPEMFVNTIFLFYGWWLIKKNSNQISFVWILLMALILVLASSLSFRSLLPSFFMWIVLIYKIISIENFNKINKIIKISILIIIPSALVVLINYELIENYNKYFVSLITYSEVTSKMGMYSKFTVGTWPGYGFLMILFLVFIAIIFWGLVGNNKLSKNSILILWLLVIALLSFYFFVAIFDSNPRGYIQSIHWVILILLLFFSLSISHNATNRYLNKLKFFVFIFSLGSAYLLYQDRNTEFHVKLITKQIAGEAESKQENFIQKMGWESSIYAQYKSRKEFCYKFNGYNVLAYSIDYHPICLNDVGSYYFSTWGFESLRIDQVPRNKPLVVISHDDGKLNEFKKLFGDEFVKYGFYGVLEPVRLR